MATKRRKRRTDRNHVIYQILNVHTGERYIGMTYARGRAFLKSAKARWTAHQYNALVDKRDTLFYDNVRKHGVGAFKVSVVKVVRGKKECHAEETQLIKTAQPELNMESMGRKKNSRKV
tara:strand:- start:1560 stop:1916 length:357 start_codon:yes stop_codon:yes gene_type:complete